MINSIVLMGRLVADPEMRTTTSGKSVASFRVAVDRSYARAGEERQTDFIPVIVWEKTAEFVCRYFSKGSMIAVQGSLQTRNYEDKNGAKRTAFEVVARDVSFCGSKAESGGGNAYGGASYAAAAAVSAPQPSFGNTTAGDFDEVSLEEEDLPF